VPRHRHGRALWLCLLTLQLVAGGHAAGELSLCIAEDGHRAVELSHHERPCRREVQRHHPSQDVHPGHGEDEHPCRDVPFVRDLPTHPTAPRAGVQPTIVALPSIVLGATTRGWTAPVPASQRASRPPGLSARRTVVIQA